jgi:putative oxidoreductase
MITRFDARLNPQAPAALSVFRIVFGLLYFLHGTSKVFGWPGGPKVPTGSWPFWWAGLIETVLGALITVGFATRPAAFIAAGEMAVAFFTQHLPGGFWPINNGGELAVLSASASCCWCSPAPVSTASRAGVGSRREPPHHAAAAGAGKRQLRSGPVTPLPGPEPERTTARDTRDRPCRAGSTGASDVRALANTGTLACRCHRAGRGDLEGWRSRRKVVAGGVATPNRAHARGTAASRRP